MTTERKRRQAPKRNTDGATGAYQTRLATAKASLASLSELLDGHAERQAKRPTDWGFVGDLGRINEQVSDLVEILRRGNEADPMTAPKTKAQAKCLEAIANGTLRRVSHGTLDALESAGLIRRVGLEEAIATGTDPRWVIVPQIDYNELAAQVREAAAAWVGPNGQEPCMAARYALDRADLGGLADSIEAGDLEEAADLAMTFDPVVRELIPLNVWAVLQAKSGVCAVGHARHRPQRTETKAMMEFTMREIELAATNAVQKILAEHQDGLAEDDLFDLVEASPDVELLHQFGAK